MNSNTPLVTFDRSVTWFKPCHGNVAVADGRVLRCTVCNSACGWLPREVAGFIATTDRVFGTPASIRITDTVPPPARERTSWRQP
jgi:hypothetical protein